MKSNIGFVFVVNSEKAFGRFVKEFAGEEEMTVVLLNRRTFLTLEVSSKLKLSSSSRS